MRPFSGASCNGSLSKTPCVYSFLTALVQSAFARQFHSDPFCHCRGALLDPTWFAVVRVLSRRGVLAMLVLIRRRAGCRCIRRQQGLGDHACDLYHGFFPRLISTLDAGLGALILFALVQIAHVTHGALFGCEPDTAQIAGSAVAFGPIVTGASWPSQGVSVDRWGSPDDRGGARGAGLPTIIGRAQSDPLGR